jgi:hypothetical protein
MYAAHIADEIRMKTTPSVLSPSSTPPRVTTPATASSNAIAFRTDRVIDSGDGDRPEELDRHALAEVDPVDREVEEQVHRRRRDAEHRGADQIAARPTAMEPGGDREQRDRGAHHPEPGDGPRLDLVEQADRDGRADVLRQRRQHEQHLGRGGRQDAVRASHRAIVARLEPRGTVIGSGRCHAGRVTSDHVFHRGSNVPVAVRAEGSTITTADGRTFLDGAGGAIACSVGHGRHEIAEAMAAQAAAVAYVHATQFETEPLHRFADRLAALVPVDDARVFPVSGGSEANESALKLARSYHLARGDPTVTS